MKSWILAGLVVMLGAREASASFELMYIPSTTDNRVYRYDPVNRVRMGSMVMNSPINVFYKGGQNGLVDSNTTGNHTMDFHSGIVGSFVNAAQFSAISGDGASVTHANSSTFSSMSILGGAIGTVPLSSTVSMFSGVRLSNGNLLTLGQDTTLTRVSIFSPTGVLFSTTTLASNSTRTSNSNIVMGLTATGQIVARFMMRSNVTAGTSTVVNSSVFSVSLNASQTGFSAAPSSFLVNTFSYSSTSTLSVAVAHNGYYLVGSDASSPATLTRFTLYNNNGSTGSAIDSWTESINTTNGASVYGVANVLAPEPGTMVAVGIGVAGLLRRRKSKRS